MASIKMAVVWPWVQIRGLMRSSWDYFRGFRFDDVIPPSVVSTINWFIGTLPRALGVRGTTRREQINANVVLIVVTLSLSLPTAGAAAIALLLWGPLLLFAWFFRGTPAGESYWRRTRSKLRIKRDYNIPFWRSE